MDILLVDDNADYLLLLREALYTSGYNVFLARDGVEAQDVLALSDVDLIVSALRLSRLDGLRLHAFARASKEHKLTRFVFVLNNDDSIAGLLKLDPKLDFTLLKTTPMKEIVKLVDSLTLKRFEDEWA